MIRSLLKSKKALFTLLTIILISLNLYTLFVAYPTMNHPLNFGGVDLPRDFSVYYIAAWRMFHNPSQIFTNGAIADGEPTIYPSLTPYKYLPSFLVIISPLINIGYYQAFWVFNAFQFVLLPLIAFLLYKLLENKNPIAALLIMIAVLLLPYPMSGRGLSVSYFMQWAEGQAKVFLTFLLVFSFYLGYTGKAKLSGIAFALACFDPRFALFGFPLFLFYNKNKLKPAFLAMALILFLSNAIVLYPGTLQGFLNMVIFSGVGTPLYTPAWIPTIAIGCLIVLNSRQMALEFKKGLDRLRGPEIKIFKNFF